MNLLRTNIIQPEEYIAGFLYRISHSKMEAVLRRLSLRSSVQLFTISSAR